MVFLVYSDIKSQKSHQSYQFDIKTLSAEKHFMDQIIYLNSLENECPDIVKKLQQLSDAVLQIKKKEYLKTVLFGEHLHKLNYT